MPDFTFFLGDSVSLDVLVENEGTQSDQQFVELSLGSTVIDSLETGVLAPPGQLEPSGSEQILTYNWTLSETYRGTGQTLEASSESSCTQCSDTRTVDVVSPFSLSIDSVTPPSGSEVGSTLTVDVTATNDTADARSDFVTLDLGGEQIGLKRIAGVTPGSSRSVTLEGEIPSGLESSAELRVSTEYAAVTQSYSLTAPFNVAITSVNPEAVNTGETVTVTADIQNTSSTSRTSDVELRIDETLVDTIPSVSVSAGSTVTKQLTWEAGAPQGTREVAVVTDFGQDTDSVLVSFTPNPIQFDADTVSSIVYLTVQYASSNSSGGSVSSLEIRNVDRNDVLYSNSGTLTFEPGESRTFIVSETVDDRPNMNGEQVEVSIDTNASEVYNLSYGAVVLSDHVHPPLPGVIEEFGGTEDKQFYPQNCSVEITANGQSKTVASGLPENSSPPFSGDGWESVVDISGDLTPGTVNTIEVGSDTIGHLQVWVEGDVYRQILGGG